MSDPTLPRLAAALADRYQVARELGAGGMATVYLARDVRHDRDVAIKLLHPDLGAVLGGERFLAEIRTTARLQHPHILPLLDSGAADGLLYYVMPFVTGETLRARLERDRPLAVDEALRITREVADALHHAHAQGIIHRDIKPENILLQGGHALVADFGIALAVQSAGGPRMTQTGLSLGTPQYMSPEQAMGERTIDARSDVYALGAVTYEMLVGEAPFTGPTMQAVVARVLTEDPRPIAVQRKAVPEHVELAVLRALEKLPADRFESAAAFADALGPAGTTAALPRRSGARPAPAPRARLLVPALAGIALVACGVAGWALVRGGDAPRDVGLPPTAPMQLEGTPRKFAVAPDGSFIVYQAVVGRRSQLWWQSLTGAGARAITGTDGANGMPLLSPDGRRVAFVAGGELRVVDVAGGTATPIAKAQLSISGRWLGDGRIFLEDDDGRLLRWIDPTSGPVRTDSVALCVIAEPWPGGGALCSGGSAKAAYVLRPDAPTRRRYLRRTTEGEQGSRPLLVGTDFRLVDSTYLVYLAMDGTVSATRLLDRDALTVGTSVPLVPGVRRNAYSAAGQFDLTPDGTLVYLPGINAEVGRLVRTAGDGRVTPLPIDEAVHPRFAASPDGRRFGAVVEGVQQQELRIYDLATGAFETIHRDHHISAPAWSPDSRRVAYRAQSFVAPDSETVYLRQLDSPEPPRALLRGAYLSRDPVSWLADDFLLITANGKTARNVLVDPSASPPRVDSLPLSSYFVMVSPDRRWIAYTIGGARGLWLQPWPALDRRWLVDATGSEPVWRSPTALVYTVQVDGAIATRQVPIGVAGASPVGRAQPVIDDPRWAETPGWSIARMADGEIAYVQSSLETRGYYVRVVPDWVRAMKRAVDAANR